MSIVAELWLRGWGKQERPKAKSYAYYPADFAPNKSPPIKVIPRALRGKPGRFGIYIESIYNRTMERVFTTDEARAAIAEHQREGDEFLEKWGAAHATPTTPMQHVSKGRGRR